MITSNTKLFVKDSRNNLSQIHVDTRKVGGMEGATGIVIPIINDPKNCVKFFKNLTNTGDRLERLQVMINQPPKISPIDYNGKKTPQISWPNGLIIDQQGYLKGFRMPLVDKNSSILFSQLLVKRERKELNITESLIGAAYNLSTIVSSIHSAGHRIIDLKPQNLFVQLNTFFVTLLDCDDYHINAKNGNIFPARTYSDEYMCPEWTGRDLRNLGMNEAQDRFALAVLIFQLLNDGYHPFAGRPKKQVTHIIGERIKAGLYPHTNKGNAYLKPPPNCPIRFLQPKTREMFELAFITTQRPSASEWADHLQQIHNNRPRSVKKNTTQKNAQFTTSQFSSWATRKPQPTINSINNVTVQEITEALTNLQSTLAKSRTSHYQAAPIGALKRRKRRSGQTHRNLLKNFTTNRNPQKIIGNYEPIFFAVLLGVVIIILFIWIFSLQTSSAEQNKSTEEIKNLLNNYYESLNIQNPKSRYSKSSRYWNQTPKKYWQLIKNIEHFRQPQFGIISITSTDSAKISVKIWGKNIGEKEILYEINVFVQKFNKRWKIVSIRSLSTTNTLMGLQPLFRKIHNYLVAFM